MNEDLTVRMGRSTTERTRPRGARGLRVPADDRQRHRRPGVVARRMHALLVEGDGLGALIACGLAPSLTRWRGCTGPRAPRRPDAAETARLGRLERGKDFRV